MAGNTNHRKNHKQKVASYKKRLEQKKYSDKKRMIAAFNQMYLEEMKKMQEAKNEQV